MIKIGKADGVVMKRYFCEKCNGILPRGKIVCDKCGFDNPELLPVLGKYVKRKKMLQIFAIVTAFAALVALLNANLLLPWQSGARRNKQIIIRYAKEHYPAAKFVEGRYNSAKIFVWNNFRDGIVFDLEGIKFNIIAEGGEILADGYPRARAEDQFAKKIYNDFLSPRSINADCAIDFFSGAEPSEDIFEFDGLIFIKLQVDSRISKPNSDWLYDFYVFLKSTFSPLKYDVSVCFFDDNKLNDQNDRIEFNSNSEFLNKSEFYASIV